jgi:hypothetical protein
VGESLPHFRETSPLYQSIIEKVRSFHCVCLSITRATIAWPLTPWFGRDRPAKSGPAQKIAMASVLGYGVLDPPW